jgi:hypothetical protein
MNRYDPKPAQHAKYSVYVILVSAGVFIVSLLSLLTSALR